jgi:hypothetical protein
VSRRHLHLAVALIAVLVILAGFHLLTGEPLIEVGR